MKIDTSKLYFQRITREELPLLVKYRLVYLTELQGKCKTDKIAKTIKELELYFEKMLISDKLIAFLVREADKILSFDAMIIKEIPGDFVKSTYLEGDILNMYTLPNARKQGISTLILEKLLSEAKLRGISKVALHASKDGENMYRKFGFSEPEYPYLEMVIDNKNFTH